MIEWRYCGRFSYMSQDAQPGRRKTWIDEEEARRRYHDQSTELTILPPVDETTGIVPYYIVLTPRTIPSFTVIYQTPPGVQSGDAWWRPTADGRLFCHMANIIDYPPADQIITRDTAWALMRVEVRNKEDGTGSIRIFEKGRDDYTRGERRIPNLDTLYRPVPEWGHWDTLATNPPAIPHP